MAAAYFLVFFLLSHLLLIHSVEAEKNPNCTPFPCGNLKPITFPFTVKKHPECGLFMVDDCSEPTPTIQLEKGGKWYEVAEIYSNEEIVVIHDRELHHRLQSRDCDSFIDNLSLHLTLPSSPLFSIEILYKQSLFKCKRSIKPPTDFNYIQCNDYIYYYNPPLDLRTLPPQCPIIELPFIYPIPTNSTDLFSLLTADISLQLKVSENCYECYLEEGPQCLTDSEGSFQCAIPKTDAGNKKLILKLALGIGCPVIFFIIIGLLIFFIRRHYKRKYASSGFLLRNTSSDPSSQLDANRSSVYFRIPIFTYTELEEATNNFDPTKELGDGGFGTVYHGKLRDGREVAVKRLYENSYKRVEQFMNEVEILTGLRHKNLVSLYGCTSRHSRELLLVYEFIPNGTIADHLHGDRAKHSSLKWPTRMSIAIETAEALAYLHASDIIHRDVKTNNILLDNNFCVKVADFGLSRLFPIDVTHVSTAPQGTLGYVDPEYRQYYQLTDKSDVYSFGVVLIELISSLPAVDIRRPWNEINLADLAIDKIQNCAINELVDPCLGFESNVVVRRMTTAVAELAFRCLQHDKEMRPYMDEVLEVLKGIESENNEVDNIEKVDDNVTRLPPSMVSNGDGLLKNMELPHSLNYVTKKWVRRTAKPSASV